MNETTPNTEALTDTPSTQRTNCSHGILLTEPCFLCAHEGVYFERDRAVYQEIAKKTRNISFDLAFALFERISHWQKASKETSLNTYFKAFKNDPDIEWSVESLKQAYYVAKEFSDLKEKKDRLKFSIYREVASAKLTTEQKKELIQKAETEGLKFSSVRRLRKEYQGKEERLIQSKTITFQSKEDLIEKVQKFFSERTDIKEGTKITITIKSQGEQNEHTKN
jgi:hypothetical protein